MPPSEPAKRGEELLQYLAVQFPATKGHIPLKRDIGVIDAEHAAAVRAVRFLREDNNRLRRLISDHINASNNDNTAGDTFGALEEEIRRDPPL